MADVARGAGGPGPGTPDPEERARVLARIRDAVLAGRAAPVPPRDVVSASWRRSLAARVDPDHGLPARVVDDDALDRVRADHPLTPVLPVLRDTLLECADEAMHVMIVTDADGTILWREGSAPVLHRADRVDLVEGTCWSESSIGTNAMGTALAAGTPVRIHSAEHLVATYRSWTCAAAPVRDPATGATVGVVDLTGPVRSFHAGTMALVAATARLAQHELAARLAARDERLRARNLPHLAGLGGPGALLDPDGRVIAASPHGWVGGAVALPASGSVVALGPTGEAVLEPLAEGWLLRAERPGIPLAPTLSLPLLGARSPVARLDGRPLPLGLRHAELLALLAGHPEGLSADELALALYGECGNPVTVRSEMHRLRSLLERVPRGPGVLVPRPYRLRARVDADFLDVSAALRSGRAPDPRLAGRGPLLPVSDAPGIRELRDEIDAGLARRAVPVTPDAPGRPPGPPGPPRPRGSGRTPTAGRAGSGRGRGG